MSTQVEIHAKPSGWAKLWVFLTQEVPKWFRYFYFLRFSILLWCFPLLLVVANRPSAARSLVSGIVTPTWWIQYLCSVFFLASASFVALILAHIVVINGGERFGDDPPALLHRLFAETGGKYEWIVPVVSQANTAIVIAYFFVNGHAEQVATSQIAWGVAWGIILAVAFWYATAAIYYLTYQPPAHSAKAAGGADSTARTMVFPRRWMLLSSDGEGHSMGDALEDAQTIPIFDWISKCFPVPGYRWAPHGELYEGHYFALLAGGSFFALYWMLWPLTAPIFVPFWSWVSIVLYAVVALVVIAVLFSARPARDADAPTLRRWEILLAVATLFFSVAIPWIYLKYDAERFPILALVLILVISISWTLGGLAFFADRFRIPVLSTVVLVIVIPRVFNWTGGVEEHYISTTVRQTEAVVPTPAEILKRKLAESPGEPLIVVTSTGGGIHAAAWTTQVLGHLEQVFAANPSLKPFHQHVLLLSTVSGGSSGLYAYLREIDPQTNNGQSDWNRMNYAAQCSGLEAVGWGLVYYDIPSILVPSLPSPGVDDLSHTPLNKDRTWALRRAFERNLNDPFCQLAPKSGPLIPRQQVTAAEESNESSQLTLGNLNPITTDLPAFTMNTTTVEGGSRFLSANYWVPPFQDGPLTPPPADSFLKLYRGIQFQQDGQDLFTDLPLATATQLSATFPYVSSAATFPDAPNAPHFHFVDGGYYDNDGTGSAIEFLRSALNELPAGSPPVRIVLVEIRNSPDTDSSPTPSTAKWNLANQLVAPLQAFYGGGHESVTARNRNALILLEGAYRGRLDLLDHVVIDDRCATYDVHTDPLNWYLTPAQQNEVATTASLKNNQEKYLEVAKYFAPGGQLTAQAQAAAQNASNDCAP